MLYDYFLTAFKVIAGLVTAERLIYAGLIAFGIYFLWVCIALTFSFQRRFYKKSFKLYNFLRKGQNNSISIDSVDKYASKISSGFLHSWRKFKREGNGKPSDYIKRRECLDVEVNGGVLNQGKSFMRAYIWLVFIGMFLFNFAYLGGTQTITCYLIAESLVLPLILTFVLKIFYFLYTVIKHQLYKSDVEIFYDTVDLLDANFGGASMVRFVSQTVDYSNETPSDEQNDEPQLDVQETEEATSESEQEETEETNEDVQDENPLDKFDIFKKKNIDVTKLMNETPNSGSSLPYINVDSDYVINDDEPASKISKPVSSAMTGSEVLGGMMQDMSSLKKSSSFIDVEKPIAKIDDEKLEELKKENEQKTEEPESTTDASLSLSDFEVENSGEEKQNEEKADESTEKVDEPSETDIPSVEAKDEILPEQTNESEEIEVAEVEDGLSVESEQRDDVSDEQMQELASIVDSFKPKKSKLASGGMVIERNERISRRARPTSNSVQDFEQGDTNDFFDGTDFAGSQQAEINRLSTNDSADTVLNSLHGFGSNSQFGFNQYPQSQPSGFSGQAQFNQGYGYEQPYQAPNAFMGQVNQNYSPVQQNQTYGGFDNYQNFDQQNFEQFDDFEEIPSYQEEEIRHLKPIIKRNEVQAKPKAQAKSTKKTTKNVGASSTSKKSVKEAKEVPMAKRGRPKKQVFDESLTIKSDKEFDEVLSRAEKLMRKSDEGLSQSQSKRIEKELKMLMDAMNRYKESK